MSDARTKLTEERVEKCWAPQIKSDHFRECARHCKLAAATAQHATDRYSNGRRDWLVHETLLGFVSLNSARRPDAM
jgi:hypothetical protein